ncbi:larval cuticle protein 2-like [Drosophila nasuta]|uniref:larval cuticle protein 2-like n=1 Tax=Drosophila nasuta TaxID=42062 RepID=UPI00295EC573|nr:larval cuticle protein 2-like [Drosophila nasuta]
MFKALIFTAIVGIAFASPLSPKLLKAIGGGSSGSNKVVPKVVDAVVPHVNNDDVHAETVNRVDDVRADGFSAVLETSNHISESRNGDVHGNIHGDYGWISPDGELIQLTYVANENGYHPKGAHLPTSPPIPAAIQRSLEWIAAHPPAPESHEDEEEE